VGKFKFIPSVKKKMLKIHCSSTISFLLGVTAAGAVGYCYILGEFKNASESLLISVKELQSSTDKVS
jgi:hypothetical protein